MGKSMARRWCTTCGAEVEDVGGYCLLGHSLALSPLSLDDVQAEIATAFEAARGKIEMSLKVMSAQLADGDALPGEPAAATSSGRPRAEELAPPSLVVVDDPSPRPSVELHVDAPNEEPSPEHSDPTQTQPSELPPPPPPAAPQGAGSRIFGPPPPPDAPEPAAEVTAGYWDRVWGADDPEAVLADPITAFAPAPSMDWGPNKTEKKRSLLKRKGA